MRHLTLGVLPVLLLATSAVSLQTPQAPKASIEGTVTRADNGQPVTGAQVTLAMLDPFALALAGGADPATLLAAQSASQQQPPPQIPAITTDNEGKFSFKNLGTGNYRVVATANGYVRQEYGQRTANGLGTPMTLNADQTLKDVVLRLTPAGTVSGRILDETGQPALGVSVQLLRPMYNVQGRVFQAAGSGNANDRGEYRLFGVTPGKYYLSIGNGPGPVRIAPGAGGPLPPGLPGGTNYALSFFPGVPDLTQAVLIEVKSGSEISFDMTARRQQLYRVRGTLIDSRTSQPPAGNVSVSLTYRSVTGGSGSFSSGRNYDATTGKFELINVTPGQYGVQAQIQEPPQAGPLDAANIEARIAAQAMRPTGTTPITVTNADVEGVEVRLNTGVSVAGKIAVEGQALSTLPNMDRIRVQLRPSVDGVPFGIGPNPGPGQVATDGSFQIAGVRDGEYLVTLTPVPPGFYLKSIRYGGADILNMPFRFSGAASGTIEAIFRPGSARLTGTVSDARSQAAAGVTAVLIPEQRLRTELFRVAQTDANGRFTITNIPPGQYRVYGLEGFEQGMQFDPDFVKRYEQQGRVIQMAESSDQNLDLRVIPLN